MLKKSCFLTIILSFVNFEIVCVCVFFFQFRDRESSPHANANAFSQSSEIGTGRLHLNPHTLSPQKHLVDFPWLVFCARFQK